APSGDEVLRRATRRRLPPVQTTAPSRAAQSCARDRLALARRPPTRALRTRVRAAATRAPTPRHVRLTIRLSQVHAPSWRVHVAAYRLDVARRAGRATQLRSVPWAQPVVPLAWQSAPSQQDAASDARACPVARRTSSTHRNP